MTNWQKALIITLITCSIGGIYLAIVFYQRRNPGIASQTAQTTGSPDDFAEVRMIFPTSFADVAKLQNTSVWMKNGYTMQYFACNSNHIDFAKPAGVIPSAQRLDIKKIIKAVPPAQVDDGISHGTRQVFAVFTLPGSPDLYATAIGAIDGPEEQYFTDLLFYYDDPHTIYDNWPKPTWAVIDQHQVQPGMSELQTRMSIGQKIQSESRSEGNRTVTYDQSGKTWTITYVNNKATTIKNQ